MSIEIWDPKVKEAFDVNPEPIRRAYEHLRWEKEKGDLLGLHAKKYDCGIRLLAFGISHNREAPFVYFIFNYFDTHKRYEKELGNLKGKLYFNQHLCLYAATLSQRLLKLEPLANPLEEVLEEKLPTKIAGLKSYLNPGDLPPSESSSELTSEGNHEVRTG
jgi:hypothetical protein